MAVTFKITDQQHEWMFTPDGKRTGRWIITFETESSVSSQVVIPDDSYKASIVAAEIAAQAHEIEAVQHLTHGEPAVHRIAHHAADLT